jgi:hypothetical protein
VLDLVDVEAAPGWPASSLSPARLGACGRPRQARKVLGWPNRCKSARTFLWEYSDDMLKLAQLLGQLGVFLTAAKLCEISMACLFVTIGLAMGRRVI